MTEIETALRTTLHEHAGRIHASPKLLGAGYRPRTRRVLPPIAMGGGVLAAGVLAAALSLAGGASTAFAGWTPRPTAAMRAQLAAANAYCTANVPTPGLPVVLTDTRGPFTFEVSSNGATDDFCTSGPSFKNTSQWTSSPPVHVAAGALFLWADHTTADAGSAYTFMIAQAGTSVAAANVTLDDGSVVTATVENGWAVAWWPGAHHLASAQLSTASGTRTQTFLKYPCAVDDCHGGPHGGAPGGGPGGG